ncbi:unnamed protein product [Nezara viridula]|uniref:Neuropeptide n=1 Tax=Nezara viridula TaxID=85310 RepID=A0A9P0GY97_NEZVI|nr:unnamed protein product [Nezara viridula]
MKYFHGIVLLIVAQCSFGEYLSFEVKHFLPGGIVDHEINDHKIFNDLANILKTITPNELKKENGMILVKLTKAQSQVVRGIRWIYEFEAIGLSSNILYSCKLVLLKPIRISASDYVNYFHCNKLNNKHLEN